MSKKSLFIAIEGLDGTGKTTLARQLAFFMQTALEENVKLTFEPHDPSCSGLFIRQVIQKKIRESEFSHETLMTAFTANRLDHCDREINKWLKEDNRIIICDRYYLSSLVYQSNEKYSFDAIMKLNEKATKPDLTLFMNASNEVCYQRMDNRNKPKELFEEGLTETREKYLKAIKYLKESRNEKIEILDASASMKKVLEDVVYAISEVCSSKISGKLISLIKDYEIPQPNTFSIDKEIPNVYKSVIEEIMNKKDISLNNINDKIRSIFNDLPFNNKGILFFNYLEILGYKIIEKYPWTSLDAFELTYDLPGGLKQRGTALLINQNQRYDVILDIVNSFAELEKMSDFMFIFSPGPSELVTEYYERDLIQSKNGGSSLFPHVQQITEKKLREILLEEVSKKLN